MKKIRSRSGRARFVTRYKAYGEHDLLLIKLAELGEWRMDANRRGPDTQYEFAFWYPLDEDAHLGRGATMRRAVMNALRSWVQEAK